LSAFFCVISIFRNLPHTPAESGKIIRYMETHLDPKISLDDIARHIGMSRKGLSSFCSHYLPCGFTVFLNTLRLNHAAELLVLAKYTLLYIALSCGFESISHFNDCFKKTLRNHSVEFQKNIDPVGVLSEIDLLA
jgi:Transcriptional regulator containing an amidase domain and an AraC-type DNA-binding HTH domain